MFKPLEMVRVVLQVPHSDVAKVTHVIARQGLFHLLDSQSFSKKVGKVGGEEFQNIMSRFTTLDQELQEIFKNLSLSRTLKKDLAVDPFNDLDDIEKAVKKIKRDLSAPSDKIQRTTKQRDEKQHQLDLLRSIVSAAPDLETVRKFTYFYKAVGFVATKDIHRLEASLDSIHYILVPLTTVEHRTLIIALCSPKDSETLDRALKSAYFEPIKLPDISQGSLEEIIQNLESDVAKLSEQREHLNQELKDTQQNVVRELQELREKVSLGLLILKAELYYGKSARTYLIVGWLPKNQLDEFQQEIMAVTEGRARFEFSEPEMIDEVQKGKLKIPILFKNPYLIRPFETLVFNYGTQDYREIDPTPFVAISFLLMFGLMFGDIGHGLFLFGLGYWIFKKFYKYMEYGIMVMECGVSSTVFGVLYGSIFGYEELPALLFHPAHNIDTLMAMAMGLGVIMISAGVIFNIVNSFQRKDYESGILGHYGIFGGIFYWMVVAAGLKYAISGDLGMSTRVLIIVLALPLSVIFFREPLGHVLFKNDHEDVGKIFPSGFFMFFLESIIDTIDVVVRYLAGTVSFLRTAAFALAHSGLLVAVFSLAEMLHQLKGGGLWYWLVVIFGNLFVIALEGLVVSIQTVRLEYYEFFSKFFKGGGERFQPLKLE